MKLSIISTSQKHGRIVGYGEAYYQVRHALEQLGHTIVPYGQATVNIWFCWPGEWRTDQGYNIAYLPWESTKLKPGWLKHLNAMEEVWTPSPVVAEWFAADGVTRPIYVYEHGVEHSWEPRKRISTGPINFYHQGADAFRKGGQQMVQAFMAAFPGDPDVCLTMKMYGQGWNLNDLGRIRVVNEALPLEELQALYYEQHVMVSNHYGEGFGLPPLQGMATGMPLICTEGWAPYKQYIDMPLGSKMIDSPWPEHHPGQVFKPNYEELVYYLRYAKDNFEELSDRAYEKASIVHRKYDWKNLTKKTFDSLAERLQNI